MTARLDGTQGHRPSRRIRYQDHFFQELARLTEIDGVSGHEQRVVAYLREQMAPLADRVEVDAMGNLYAIKEGGDGPHLMVEAQVAALGILPGDQITWQNELEPTANPDRVAYGDTDGSAIRDSGIPTAVVTMPRRYSHSPVEILDLNDALATLRVCREVVRRVGEFPRGIL